MRKSLPGKLLQMVSFIYKILKKKKKILKKKAGKDFGSENSVSLLVLF